MHFITRATALLAFAASALAVDDPDPTFDAITKPGLDEKVTAGETYTIEWIVPPTAPAGPVTISLLGGKDGGSLHPIADVGKGIENSALKFDWDVDSALGAFATYGLKITLEADPTRFQFSTPFHIVGGDGGNSTDPSTTGSVSTTASKGSTSTSSGSETTSTSGTAKTTEEPSTSMAMPMSGTTMAPATKTTDSGASGSGSGAVGVLGGLALAVLAL